jgi:hypothetical protein
MMRIQSPRRILTIGALGLLLGLTLGRLTPQSENLALASEMTRPVYHQTVEGQETHGKNPPPRPA